jgi:hypothetical protein
MFLRVIGAGMVGMAVMSVVTTAAAGVLVACAVRRCARKRADWPAEAAPPPMDDEA